MKRQLLLLLLLAALSVSAQTNYRQRLLTTDNGLSSNSVHAIVQDRQGFIWIGTDNGLCRYDGTGVKVVLPSDENVSPAVTSLSIDADGYLLVGSKENVYRYDPSDESFELLHEENNDSLASDKYSGEDNKSAISSLTINKDSITAKLQTADGNQWIGTSDNRLVRIDSEGSEELMPSAGPSRCQHINTLFAYSDTQLLLGCDDGLWLFDTVNRTYTLHQPTRFVCDVMRDHEGGLWTATKHNGVLYESPIEDRFTGISHGLTARLVEDRHGRIWTEGTDGRVDCYQDGHLLENIPEKKLLSNLSAHSLQTDGDNLWIGTYSDGVYRLNTATHKLRHYTVSNSGLYDANACTVYRDRKGRIWVATMEGLSSYNRSQDRFERIAKINSVPVCISEDADGLLWVATQATGIWCCDSKGETFSHHNIKGNGLSLPNDMVNHIAVDRNGIVWVATKSGLCRYNAENKYFVHIDLSMPQKAVNAIVEDQGVLWLSTDNGIVRYEPGKDIQRFTRQDGLENEQFYPGSALKTADGRIIFGSATGYSIFRPKLIKANSLRSPVFITGLEVYNNAVSVGSWRLPRSLTDVEQIDIYNDDKMFSLEFASLSYCSPEKNMYAYMLEGFDKQWNYVGNDHRATYTNLPAGTYTFRVRATNNDGIWSDREARLQIHVHPPFWWSTYAKVAYVILAILLLWLFIAVRLKLANRRHRREMEQLKAAQKEQLQRERTEFFTTIAHEIRTPVSLITAPLDQLKRSELIPVVRELAGRKPAADEHITIQAQPLAALYSQLKIIDRNATKLLDIVNQVLDFRKVQHDDHTETPLQLEKKLRMLIVDDNEDMLTFLVTTLMDRFDVVPAHDGLEAMQHLEESLIVRDGHTTSAFDIIVSDWMMPGMEGIELCRRLRQNSVTLHVPFVMVSARTDSQSKVDAMQAGVDAFVEKPFAVAYLEACITNVLAKRKQKT